MSVPYVNVMDRTRRSFTARLSGLFGQADAGLPDHQAARHTATYEVPLFLSPSRYRRSEASDTDPPTPRDIQAPRQSFGRAAASRFAAAVHPASAPSPSQYSIAGTPPIDTPAMFGQAPSSLEDDTITEDTTIKSRRAKPRPQKQRRRRRPSTRQRIQTLKHFSFAYGVTLLATIITYLVLAFARIASGVAFHAITIIFLLILTGLFLHSAIRLVLLARHAKKKRQRSRVRQHWYGDQGQDEEAGLPRPCKSRTVPSSYDLCLEKPVQIIMKEDELRGGQESAPCANNIPRPPPVYGNFRGSKRIDPSLVHWQKICPSPLTPTYAEAMNDVHRAMGYRPPSYIQSECGISDIVQAQDNDVEGTLRDMHPLERKRVTPFTERHV